MFSIRVKGSDDTGWSNELHPNEFEYSLVDISSHDSRTMDDVAHKLKTSQKVEIKLTFNQNLTVDFMHDILVMFSKQYLDVLYFDIYEKAEIVKHFKVDNRSTKIMAWNDTFKRFHPIQITLIER